MKLKINKRVIFLCCLSCAIFLTVFGSMKGVENKIEKRKAIEVTLKAYEVLKVEATKLKAKVITLKKEIRKKDEIIDSVNHRVDSVIGSHKNIRRGQFKF